MVGAAVRRRAPAAARAASPSCGAPRTWRRLAPAVVVGFGLEKLELPAGRRPIEAGPLAGAALRLAALRPPEWDAELLRAPLYLRDPAVTTVTAAADRRGDRATRRAELRIEPARAGDLDASSGWSAPSPIPGRATSWRWRWSIRRRSCSWRAQRGEVEGYAAFRRGAGEAELLRLAVEPPSRRRGLGRRLTLRGLDILRAEGCAACHLEVRTGNAGAIALYEGLGFDRVGVRPRYYSDGADALVLRRAL